MSWDYDSARKAQDEAKRVGYALDNMDALEVLRRVTRCNEALAQVASGAMQEALTAKVSKKEIAAAAGLSVSTLNRWVS